jgi:hypothetical protein
MNLAIDHTVETHTAAALSAKRAGAQPGIRNNENNAKFANDGSLGSVDKMLHKLARRCYGRVTGMGLPMELDDILQEMRVSYILAKEKWDSQAGSLFSTYCTTVCMNNFNNTIKRMERQRTLGKIEDTVCPETGKKIPARFQRQFGLICEHEMHEDQGNLDSVTEGMSGSATDQPDYRLEQAQNTKLRMSTLSVSAKKIVAILLSSEKISVSPAPRLRQIAHMAKVDGKELKRVKLEILKTFGVTWP